MKKIALIVVGFIFIQLNAQTVTNVDGSEYQFTQVYDIEATSVKNQGRSGTCWSFSTLSFFESELMRMGKGTHDLSEMFVVRNCYVDKAVKYVRMHGKTNFGPGGAFHDPLNTLRNYGMIPQAAYPNTLDGSGKINHKELNNLLEAYVEVLAEAKGTITSNWLDGYKGILDVYLGQQPETFTYEGKQYTPESFGKYLGLNADDYIDITSYTHHPFYEKFVLEIPDNWSWDPIHNVPLDDMMEILEYALSQGFTLAWGADVSDKGFSHKNGIALIPEMDWTDMSKSEKKDAYKKPVPQKTITQEMRQDDFDSFETTDDHGMQITGMYKDQNGLKWFKIKNSWGTGHGNCCGGYFYASENYVRLRTMNIMLHKDGIPKNIKKKMGI